MSKISIITVCFNSAKTIRDTLDSVAKQKYDDYEYIVIDGESNDDTLSIVEKYKDRIKSLNIVCEQDNGIFDAMNKGIKKSQSPIIGIINSDDWYSDDSLKFVAEYFEQNPNIDILAGSTYFTDYNKNVLEYRLCGKVEKYIEKVMPLNHPAMFVKKELYEKLNGYNLKYKLASDYDFVCRAYLSGAQIYIVDNVLAYMRAEGATSSFGNLQGLRRQLVAAYEEKKIIENNFNHSCMLRYCIRVFTILFKYVLYKLHLADKVIAIKRKIFGRWM